MTQLEFAFETKNHFALVIECSFLLKSRLSWRGIVLPVKESKENERRRGKILFFVDFSRIGLHSLKVRFYIVIETSYTGT